MIKPGGVFAGRFTLSDPDNSGTLSDADSLPTGSFIRNGDVDGAASVTVSNISTGIYKYSVTVPSGYDEGDSISVQITGALNANNFGGLVASDSVVADYIPQPAEIWKHTPRTITQTGEELYSILSGTLITLHRGDDLSLTFTDLGDISSYSKIWFTVKTSLQSIADSASEIQVLEASGTGSDGLLYINGGSPASSANGSITVDDAASGDITIAVTALEMAKLSVGSKRLYDVQMLDISDNITTLTSGGCTITQDVTRSTS